MRIEARPRERLLAGLGAALLAVSLICAAVWPAAALTGWLGIAVMLQAIPMGALALLAMMQLIRGEWEQQLRPMCEAAALLLPIAALAFVPVLLGMGLIYHWDSAPEPSAFQSLWLTPAFFALRTIAWFAALALIARSQVGRRAPEGASALALIVLLIGGSLMAIDWLMSLDPKFHSSGFGLQLFALELASAYMVVLIGRYLLAPEAGHPAILGGLLLVFLLLWAYFQFLPYFIIWSGNLPDGVGWYRLRSGPGWDWVIWTFGALGMVPLLALLFPTVRESPRWLALAAATALTGKAFEFAWFAIPGQGLPAALAYLLALAGAICLCLAGLPVALRLRSERREHAREARA